MKLSNTAAMIVTGAIMVFIFGMGVRTSATMPGYAAVYLDDEEKIYIALPCMDEWHKRKMEEFSFVRLFNASEARQLNYRSDDTCRNSGALVGIDKSLIFHILTEIGLLPRPIEWWDRPYRTDDGVVFPGR